MKDWDRILREARNNHVKNHPDHEVWIGLNFLECITCGAHAHMSTEAYPLPLIRHDSACRLYEGIQAEQF